MSKQIIDRLEFIDIQQEHHIVRILELQRSEQPQKSAAVRQVREHIAVHTAQKPVHEQIGQEGHDGNGSKDGCCKLQHEQPCIRIDFRLRHTEKELHIIVQLGTREFFQYTIIAIGADKIL